MEEPKMLLDRIDIDTHGPLSRVELGPFSEHLNVVYGPAGSGKTAIVRFIRDSLVQREYPLGMLSSSSGRVVWADRHGLVHCRRETDGTPHGRRTVELERRGGFDYQSPNSLHGAPASNQHPFYGHQESWFGGIGSTNDAELVLQTVRIPESVVDGIMTDTSISSVARVIASAIAAGLDRDDLHQDLPLHYDSFTTAHADLNSTRYDQNAAALRAELADIDAELAYGGTRSAVRPYPQTHDPVRRQRLRHALQQAQREAHDLRIRREEMRRWMSLISRDLDSAMNDTRYRDHYQSLDQLPGYRYRSSIDDASLRARLDRVDNDILQVRRIMEQIRDLRNLVAQAGQSSPPIWSTPWDAAAIADQRYRGFVHAIDHYGMSYDWNQTPIDDFWAHARQYDGRPYRSIHEIDARIEAACRQIEDLIRRASEDRWEGIDETLSGSDRVARLRTIRHDLESVRWTSSAQLPYTPQSKFETLDRDAQWLDETVRQLSHHREHLLREANAKRHQESLDTSWYRQVDYYALHQDRQRCASEVRRLDERLHHVLAHAAQLRREMRHLPIADAAPIWDSAPISRERVDMLHRRRLEILARLQSTANVTTSTGPLAEIASRWLVRLSGGRLRRVDWNRRSARTTGDVSSVGSLAVMIGQREEAACSVQERTLAALAVRMAAGQLLAQTGNPIPLVIELASIDRRGDSLGSRNDSGLAYADHGPIGRVNDPIAAALRDYCGGGRQIIVLTSDESLAGQLHRVGARHYRLRAERIVHSHRPLWRPHYEQESYVGPMSSSGRVVETRSSEMYPSASMLDDSDHSYVYPRATRFDDNHECSYDVVNREFDAAWISQSAPYPSDALPRTDWAIPGAAYRNGYDHANRYTTAPVQYDSAYMGSVAPHVYSPIVGTQVNHPADFTYPMNSGAYRYHEAYAPGESVAVPAVVATGTASMIAGSTPVELRPANPFFLSVDSPIDQAPSIDAVAASRLRSLKVTHVNHLMQQDSNRLADSLGLTNVDASTIRRWQAECRLACQVPQLRGFDAKVLVGCGVTTPAQLASMHPIDLLRDVEAFLATQRGQQILLSGSSQELSRLTSWIAAANAGFHQNKDKDHFDNDRYEMTPESRRKVRRRRYLVDAEGNRIKMIDDDITDADDSNREAIASGLGSRGFGNAGTSSMDPRAFESRRSARPDRSARDDRGRRDSVVPYEREHDRQPKSDRQPRTERQPRSERQTRPERESRPARETKIDRPDRSRETFQRQPREARHESSSEMRFFLHRQDAVVDAPSVGPRLASRLAAFGIQTVDDLLSSDAESVASQLNLRSVDADTVLAWQQQTTLCCRIPMLRGHDAQLLVAAEITTPEELASYSPEALFEIIDPIAQSADGKRILRGSKSPDLAEVTDWIRFANHHRDLQAA
jgi:predicted flap endonuclease-1-like 5' DNA nuclease